MPIVMGKRMQKLKFPGAERGLPGNLASQGKWMLRTGTLIIKWRLKW